MSSVRLTTPVIAVLNALLNAAPDAPPWGTRICRDADLGTGTVYPILARLQTRGWVTSWGETGPHPGRPGRVFYALTEAGRVWAVAALEAREARMP